MVSKMTPTCTARGHGCHFLTPVSTGRVLNQNKTEKTVISQAENSTEWQLVVVGRVTGRLAGL